MRPEGDITRGTTNPSRLRRVDRWITQIFLNDNGGCTSGGFGGVVPPGAHGIPHRPLVVDLGFGASPVTTIEMYRRIREVRPDAEVTGLEIDPGRVAHARERLAALRAAGDELPALSFGIGGFELAVARQPALVRAFNVLRQYPEEQAWAAWSRLRSGLAGGGVLVEGTCDEIGRRCVWVTLPARPDREALITFSARLASLERPSDLAERLPKTLIHRNVPGEPVHQFLRDFDRAWDSAAPYSVFGPRQRWLVAVTSLSAQWPVLRRPPFGGPRRWRLGEVTIPWAALAPPGRIAPLLCQTAVRPQ
ncbi:MAG: class I SAM-dependent methyltransferase [Trebonia sp.]